MTLFALALAPAFAADPAPAAGAQVGQKAPAFTLTDVDGKTVSLADYAGKTVVLEWFNPGCPFVVYAHGEGPLKGMASAETAGGDVVWLSVNSGAPGKQGYGADANKAAIAQWGMTNAVLLDESGAVGKAYGAKTTPHMFVIDGKGTLQYAGGLDNAPLGTVDGGGALQPYTKDAVGHVKAGKTPTPASTKPYGCSVKYAS